MDNFCFNSSSKAEIQQKLMFLKSSISVYVYANNSFSLWFGHGTEM